MTIGELIGKAKDMAGSAVSDSQLLDWINDIEGQIAFDFFGIDAFMPYTTDDLTSEPLVGWPWGEQIYVHFLEAMIYYAHAEYERYSNAKTMHDTALWDFRRYYNRTRPYYRCCPYRCRVREEDPLNA